MSTRAGGARHFSRLSRLSRRARARAAVLAISAALAGWGAWGIFLHEPGTPRVSPDTAPALLTNLAEGDVVAQTFRMGSDGLDGITIFPVWSGRPGGRLSLELGRVEAEGVRPIYSREFEAEATSSGTLSFRFPALPDSGGDTFRLAITVLVAESAGLALRTSDTVAYRDGALTLNGGDRWGDLAFETSAERATAWSRGVAALAPMVGRRAATALLGIGLLIYGLGLFGLVAYAVR